MNFRICFKATILFISICKTVHLQAATLNGVTTEHTIPCEDGWMLFGENCYKAVVEPLPWAEASAHCASTGGHLTSIHSKDEQDFITTFMLLPMKTPLWIGLHDTANKGHFVWDDGTDVDYTFWSRGEPSRADTKGVKEDCVDMNYRHHLYANSEWNDVVCHNKRSYICKKKKNEDLNSPDPLFCSIEKGGGWKFQGVCYNLINQTKSWDDAEQYCKDNFKGHLVTISDVPTDKFLNYHLKHFGDSLWIGIKLRDQLQQKWTSGWHVAYSYLPNKVPAKSTDEVCVLRSETKAWIEMLCNADYPFICESFKGNPVTLKNPDKGLKCPQPTKDWRDLDGEFCYYFHTRSKLTWHRANTECSRKGGTLASIHSQEENEVLLPFVENTQNQLFIGLNSLLSGGVYMWADGTPLDFTYWSKGEPSGGNEKCVEIYTSSMRWNDVICDATRGFICSVRKVPPSESYSEKPVESEIPLSASSSNPVEAKVLLTESTVEYLVPQTEIPPEKPVESPVSLQNETLESVTAEHTIPCEEGWVLFGENCYKAVMDRLRWSEASAQCAKTGGHLTSIHSKEEQDFITTFMLLPMKIPLWIGLHDTTNDGNYVWEDGTNVDYTFWSPGEPSRTDPKGIKEDCVNMNYRHFLYANSEWNDVDCRNKYSYVCKKKRNEALNSPDPLFCSLEKGGGWKFQGACYNVVNEKKSWYDAEEYCRDNYKGHLVTISDEKKNRFLNYHLKGFSEAFWIGIKLRDQLQQKWTSGWHVAYGYLKSKVPEMSTEEVCVLRSQLKVWLEMPCKRDYPFICESLKENPVILTNTLEGSKCPKPSNTWRDLDGEFCYYFDTAKKATWFQAKAECARRGGTLASIHSQEENEVLLPFVENTQNQLFIGLNSLISGGIYMWSDGTPVDFTYWSNGEPSGGKEKCVEVYTGSMRWNDVLCEATRGFICSARKVPLNESSIEKPDASQEFCTTPNYVCDTSMEENGASDVSNEDVSQQNDKTIKIELTIDSSDADHLSILKKCKLQKENDSDFHFLVSLYDDMKKVPEDKKIRAKKEMLDVIKRSQESGMPPITLNSPNTVNYTLF